MSVRCTLCSVGLLGCLEDEPIAVVSVVFKYFEEILPKAFKGLIRMRNSSPPIYKPPEIPFLATNCLFCFVWLSTCLVQRRQRISEKSFHVLRFNEWYMNTWLSTGMRAVPITVALWSIFSLWCGGQCPAFDEFRGSILAIMVSTVMAMVLPRYWPRCLMLYQESSCHAAEAARREALESD